MTIQKMRWFRLSAFGLMCAALAVALALLTSPAHRARASGAAARQVTTDVQRPAATFAVDPDLGTVVVNQAFTRQIVVQNGFKPHKFIFGATLPTNTGIKLSESGTLSGTPDTIGVDTFDVVVTDNPQMFTSQTFTLTVVAATTGGSLHFAESEAVDSNNMQTINLPKAVAHEPFSYTLQLNGGDAPFTFVLEVPGAPLTPLPAGLAFNWDTKEISGTPIDADPAASFTFDVSDSRGRVVIGTFVLDVLPGTISSQIVATAGTFKLDFGQQGRDTLDLRLALDKTELSAANIRTAADLNGRGFVMNFGGVPLPPAQRFNSDGTPVTGATSQSIVGQFNNHGVIALPVPFKVAGETVGEPRGEVTYNLSLDPRTGILNAHFTNLYLIRTLGANFNDFAETLAGGPTIPINVQIGPTAGAAPNLTLDAPIFDKRDVAQFAYTKHLNVAVGKAGANVKLAPAGLFLINKVAGKIEAVKFLDGTKGERLFLRLSGFLHQPGGLPVVPLLNDSVTVYLKALPLDTFPASSFGGQGSQLVFTNFDQSIGLHMLTIDNKKGTFVIETNAIDPGDLTPLGEQLFIGSEAVTVPVTLTISGAVPGVPTFDGQSSVTIFRQGSSIRNK